MPKNMIQEQCDQWWFSHQRSIQQVELMFGDGAPKTAYQIMREMTNARFEAGARWAMRETSQMNPTITRFLEMCMLLGFGEYEPSKLAGEESEAEAGSTGNDVQEHLPGLRDNVLVSAASSGHDSGTLQRLLAHVEQQKTWWEHGAHGQSQSFQFGKLNAYDEVLNWIREIES